MTRFFELGPDRTLSAIAALCAGDDQPDCVCLSTLLGAKTPQRQALLAFLGAAHACGADVNWRVLFASGAASAVELPSYAFQRERYWLTSGNVTGDLEAAGQLPGEHSLWVRPCLSPATATDGCSPDACRSPPIRGFLIMR